MTTELERRLRDALDEDAQRARLVNPRHPALTDVRDLVVDRSPRRGARLVAVAAVIAVLALVAAVTMFDDDQSVDTTPAIAASELGTIVTGNGCAFGIAGEPVVMQTDPGELPLLPRFPLREGEGWAHTSVGVQDVEVSVPGHELADQGAWRMEDIDLQRGPATVWLDGPPSGPQDRPFVQVRYFPGAAAPCSSFTVTADGGTEAENRETAIAFAERIVLPAEFPAADPHDADAGSIAGLELTGTRWAIFDSSAGPISAPMEFGGPSVTWDNGCAPAIASYALDRDGGALVLSDRVAGQGCGPPTTAGRTPHYAVIDAVMDAERVPVRQARGLLYLGDPDGDFIVLAPSAEPAATPVTLPEPGDQPADAQAAEAEIRSALLTLADTSISAEARAPLSERPATWLAAAHDTTRTQYWDLIQTIREKVREVVFVSPTHAVVSMEWIADDPVVPRDHVIDALLVDGHWVMAIASSCEGFRLIGVECDMSL
ncbi:MAG: hypothetical protein ACJ739_16260 [Acidimicrobiales bacterium]